MTEIENEHNIRMQSEISGSSRQSANVDTTSDNHQELMNSQLELKYGPENIVKLCAPVSLCIFIVVFTINNVKFFTTKDIYLVYTPFHEESKDSTTILWNSFANSLILMTVVIVMTMLLIFLYKYKFYKIISIWLILSSFMLLFIFTYMYFIEFLVAFNYPMDYVTALLFLWNFGVVGIISIHLSGPIRLQQMYLIFISALMALVFIKYMPEFTTWVVLAVMSIWDLYAVLTPRGPLRVLVETAQERNDAIFPSLIYSSNIMTIDENEGENGPQQETAEEEEQSNEGFSNDWVDGQKRFRNTNEDCSEVVNNLNTRPNYIFESRNETVAPTEKGVKLGLGDFIFYSVLVGKASCVSDWNIPLACYIAILMGLILTMVLLAMFKKALPALPISITFGLIMYFTSVQFIKPFVDQLAVNQIFI